MDLAGSHQTGFLALQAQYHPMLLTACKHPHNLNKHPNNANMSVVIQKAHAGNA
eukprot:m.209946 g.209946  ORF g.209946 m.209946 type:complete len:54 (-) comp15048_c0_seq30:61-222(-)